MEISGDAHASRPWKHYTSLEYPAFDLCAPLDGHGVFDVVICEQVIEHVPDPVPRRRTSVASARPAGMSWSRRRS